MRFQLSFENLETPLDYLIIFITLIVLMTRIVVLITLTAFDNIIVLITLSIVEHEYIFVFRETVSPDVECCPIAQVEEDEEERKNDEKDLEQLQRSDCMAKVPKN